MKSYKLMRLAALFAVCFVGSQVLFAGETAERKSSRVVESSRLPFSFRRTVEVTRSEVPVAQVSGDACNGRECGLVTRRVERTSRGRLFRIFRSRR